MSTAKQSDRSSAHRRKMPKPAGDEVGYGRPPAAHRFKPGHSGNPRGRPKGGKNEATILRNLLNRKIDVRQGGTARKITVFEAILLRITEDALKGNTKSAAFLFNRCAGTEADAQPEQQRHYDRVEDDVSRTKPLDAQTSRSVFSGGCGSVRVWFRRRMDSSDSDVDPA